MRYWTGPYAASFVKRTQRFRGSHDDQTTKLIYVVNVLLIRHYTTPSRITSIAINPSLDPPSVGSSEAYIT
jgi:hypothetical protein